MTLSYTSLLQLNHFNFNVNAENTIHFYLILKVLSKCKLYILFRYVLLNALIITFVPRTVSQQCECYFSNRSMQWRKCDNNKNILSLSYWRQFSTVCAGVRMFRPFVNTLLSYVNVKNIVQKTVKLYKCVESD